MFFVSQDQKHHIGATKPGRGGAASNSKVGWRESLGKARGAEVAIVCINRM